MQKFTLLIFFLLGLNVVFGQKVEGRIIDGDTGSPVEGVSVSIREWDEGLKSLSDAGGLFSFDAPKSGRYSYAIKMDGYENLFSNFTIVDDEGINLGDITIYKVEDADNKDVSYLSETEISESEESMEVVSLLTASQDEFNRTAAFDFGVARFKIRGYHPNFSEIYLNGMPMNDLDDGYAAWSVWGGLNDVMRRRQSNHNLEPSFFAFGGLGGWWNSI